MKITRIIITIIVILVILTITQIMMVVVIIILLIILMIIIIITIAIIVVEPTILIFIILRARGGVVVISGAGSLHTIADAYCNVEVYRNTLLSQALRLLFQSLAQDKGGPSKGGFLNNMISIYGSVCAMKLMACAYKQTHYSGISYIIQETTFIGTTFVLACGSLCFLLQRASLPFRRTSRVPTRRAHANSERE